LDRHFLEKYSELIGQAVASEIQPTYWSGGCFRNTANLLVRRLLEKYSQLIGKAVA
jgi:hypothetical protein